MSAVMCARAVGVSDANTNARAYVVWKAAFQACIRSGFGQAAAIEHAYRIELLYRALVVVMARRGG